MVALHCSYDKARMARVYEAIPARDKDRIEELKQKISTLLLDRASIQQRITVLRAREIAEKNRDQLGYAALAVVVAAIAFLRGKLPAGRVHKFANFIAEKGIEKGKTDLREKSVDTALGETRGKTINDVISLITLFAQRANRLNLAGAFLEASKPASVATDVEEWSLGLELDDQKIAELAGQLQIILDSYYDFGFVSANCEMLIPSTSPPTGPTIGPR
jgi:hypothetical protein